MQTLIDFFGTQNLMPHGYCLSWNPVLLCLHVASDVLITLSYYSIPLSLAYFIRKRKDLPYAWLIIMGALFIVACGTTHLMSAVLMWIPLYWLDGYLKAFTAVISVATAIAMWRIIPIALTLPSAGQLQREINERNKVETELNIVNTRFQMLFGNMLNGIAIYEAIDDGNDFVFRDFNRAGEIMDNITREALLHKSVTNVFPDVNRFGLLTVMKRVWQTGNAEHVPTALYDDGRLCCYRNNYVYRLPSGEIVTVYEDATESRKAQLAQQESAERLHKIANQLPNVVFQFRMRADGSFCVPYANEVLRDIYRVSPEEVREDATAIFAVVHPDDLASHIEKIKTSAQNLTPWSDEYRLKFADGSERWLLGSALPQREVNDSTLWHGFVMDITQRKQSEIELHQSEIRLRESENKLATILDSVEAYIYIKDTQSRYQYANRLTRQLFNRPLEAIIGKSDGEFFPSKTAADIRQNDLNVFESGELMTTEEVDATRGITYLAIKQPLRYDDGTIYGICGISTDITARKRVENALKASEERLNLSQEYGGIGSWEADLVNKKQIWSPAMYKLVQLPVSENPTWEDFFALIHPDDRQIVLDANRAHLTQKEKYDVEYRIVIDGQTRWMRSAGKAEFSPNGTPLRFIGIAQDITERKQAELAQRESEEKLRAFYELNLVGLTITSTKKGWIRTNDCLCNMLEYPEEILHQMTWEELTYPDDLAKDNEQFYRLLNNEIDGYTLEKRFVSRTGKIIPTKLVVRCIRKANGEVDYVMAMVEDITDYKEAEAELKRSNAELEQFAYAVSHDMRQPLRMVTSYLALIESALATKLDEETRQFLNFAVDGAKRMDAMILSLLDYSRVGRRTQPLTFISSRAAVDEALVFLKPELDTSGGQVDIVGDWVDLLASRDELTRLFQNLIGNALKYHEENKPPVVNVRATVQANTFKVEVCDLGIGIAPNQRDRLFKVFSRLQARSRFEGTGVGLALCRKIVEHHGGKIGVESEGEGCGCCFWFELPLLSLSTSLQQNGSI